MLTVSSEYFELLASVTLLDEEMKMRSLMKRDGAGSAVFMREFQAVPQVLTASAQTVASSFDCYDPLLDDDES